MENIENKVEFFKVNEFLKALKCKYDREHETNKKFAIFEMYEPKSIDAHIHLSEIDMDTIHIFDPYTTKYVGDFKLCGYAVDLRPNVDYQIGFETYQCRYIECDWSDSDTENVLIQYGLIEEKIEEDSDDFDSNDFDTWLMEEHGLEPDYIEDYIEEYCFG